MNVIPDDHAATIAIVGSGLLGLHLVERFGLYRNSPRAIVVALTAFVTSTAVYQTLIVFGAEHYLAAVISLPPAALCSWGLARKFTKPLAGDATSANSVTGDSEQVDGRNAQEEPR